MTTLAIAYRECNEPRRRQVQSLKEAHEVVHELRARDDVTDIQLRINDEPQRTEGAQAP